MNISDLSEEILVLDEAGPRRTRKASTPSPSTPSVISCKPVEDFYGEVRVFSTKKDGVVKVKNTGGASYKNAKVDKALIELRKKLREEGYTGKTIKDTSSNKHWVFINGDKKVDIDFKQKMDKGPDYSIYGTVTYTEGQVSESSDRDDFDDIIEAGLSSSKGPGSRGYNESVSDYYDEVEEGDFFKDSDGNVYVVADISTRHVAMFDIKNKVKVISYGDIKNFTPVTDGKEFNSLNKKFDRVTTGDKYLNYSLNESTESLTEGLSYLTLSDKGQREVDKWTREVTESLKKELPNIRFTSQFKMTASKPFIFIDRYDFGDNDRIVEAVKKVLKSKGAKSITVKSEKVRSFYGEIIAKFHLDYSLYESTQTSNIEAGNKVDYMEISDSDLVGRAFEFEDGIYVVTDVIDGIVYMIGPDDDMYQISLDDFENEVGDEVSDDEDINEAVKGDIKSQVTDVMIRHWISKNRGMSDSQWQKFAERLSDKFGWSFDEIDDEWKRQVGILSDLYDKDRAKYNQVKKAAENKKELVF